MAIVKSERLLREKLRKRRTNLFKKANELARMTNSKIYVVVQHDDKYYTYKSTEELNWPPPEREIGIHDHKYHRRPADFHGLKPQETQRMRKASQHDKGQVGFKFPKEAEHNGDRALASRRTLTAAQNKSVLRGGLEGLQRGG
ncbi:MAG: hypothetical protein Q9191_000237 [Dirinaria sp. TL-2023a]